MSRQAIGIDTAKGVIFVASRPEDQFASAQTAIDAAAILAESPFLPRTLNQMRRTSRCGSFVTRDHVFVAYPQRCAGTASNVRESLLDGARVGRYSDQISARTFGSLVLR